MATQGGARMRMCNLMHTAPTGTPDDFGPQFHATSHRWGLVTMGESGVRVRGVVFMDLQISGSLMGCYGMAILSHIQRIL